MVFQACQWLEVEIISLELGQKLPFRLRPKMLAAAVARGVMFEVRFEGETHRETGLLQGRCDTNVLCTHTLSTSSHSSPHRSATLLPLLMAAHARCSSLICRHSCVH